MVQSDHVEGRILRATSGPAQGGHHLRRPGRHRARRRAGARRPRRRRVQRHLRTRRGSGPRSDCRTPWSVPSTTSPPNAELLLLAVPDAELARLVSGSGGHVVRCKPGTIVVHTSGANGIGILAPLTEHGCVPLAIHPAMTFTGADEDIARLADTCFGITAADEIGYAIAQALVLEIGGEPFGVREDARTLYHAALAHASNHVVTVVADALEALRAALRGSELLGQETGRRRARAASPNGSSRRWPARRWRTRCSAVRPRSPDRSPAVTPPPSPAISPRCAEVDPELARPTGPSRCAPRSEPMHPQRGLRGTGSDDSARSTEIRRRANSTSTPRRRTSPTSPGRCGRPAGA